MTVSSKLKAFGLAALATGMTCSASTTSASASGEPDYWACYVAAYTSPMYMSAVFYSDYGDTRALWRKRDRFMADVFDTFGKHPDLVAAGDEYRPTCISAKTRAAAEETRMRLLNGNKGSGRSLYDTGWTPEKGIQSTEAFYVSDRQS